MIYQKGTNDIKKEFLATALENIVLVCYNEHGKGLVLYLYKANESNKIRILEAIKKNIKALATNNTSITLLDEIYNLNRTEKRAGFSSIAMEYSNSLVDPVKEGEIVEEMEKDTIHTYKTAFPKPIFKLFDKRLLNFELIHDILFHYFSSHKDKYKYLHGILIRNKQFKYLLLTHKGLELSLGTIEHTKDDILKYI